MKKAKTETGKGIKGLLENILTSDFQHLTSGEAGNGRSLTDNVVDLKSLIAPDGIGCYPDHLLMGSRGTAGYTLFTSIPGRSVSGGWTMSSCSETST